MSIRIVDGYLRFSKEERARRFAAVRERMRLRGVVAIIVQANSSKWDCGAAEVRYLSHIGGNGEEGYLVFDLRHEPAYITAAGSHIDNWLSIQDWTKDIRASVPSAAQAVAGRIKELGFERETVGLVGRGPGPLTPDGRWPTVSLETIRHELPDAVFVDFDDDLARIRAIKSDEELTCHERAMTLTEEAIAVMLSTARVGVAGSEVFGRMVGSMVSHGADMSVMVQLNISAKPRLAARLITHRPIARGDVILNEVTAKYSGYWSQAHAPVSVGNAPAHAHQRLFDLVYEGLRQGEANMAPGVTVSALARAIRVSAEEVGCGWSDIPTVKGIGLATSEFPISAPAESASSPYGSDGMQASLQEGMVICLQPSAWDRAAGLGMHVAETYVVTRTGCRRLGRRNIAFHVT